MGLTSRSASLSGPSGPSGLSGALAAGLARHAARRPATFVVTAPGGTAARLGAEAELRRRGWPSAAAPPSAEALIVCGDPGEELARAIDVAWADMPNPRIRVRIPADADLRETAESLDGATAGLADLAAQRAAAAERVAAGPWRPEDRPVTDHSTGHSTDHSTGHSMDHPVGHSTGHSMDHSAGHSMDHSAGHSAGPSMEHSMGDGGGHEHHMGAVEGLAMASRGDDRDGLKLDQLHVPLGPVLAAWPAGLIVRTTLQGDVVQDAEVAVAAGTGGRAFWDEPWLIARAGDEVPRGRAERRRAAAHLDSLGRLLVVAGWEAAAVRAVRLRDDVLARERPALLLAAEFGRLARRLERSRLLRWMLRDVGVIDPASARDLPGPAGAYPGDVRARMAGWIAAVRASLDRADDPYPLPPGQEGPRGPAGERPSAALLEALPPLLRGAELAAARLIVASLDPDLDRLAEVPADE